MAIIPDTNLFIPSDIKNVLYKAGGDVTDDMRTFFQDRAKLNKCAKYKPVKYKKDTRLTETERSLANHGLDVDAAYSKSISELFSLASNEAGWGYLPPVGGVNEPLRLSDFCKYNTNAQEMFLYYSLPSTISAIGTPVSTELRFLYNPNAELKPSDFAWFDDMGGARSFHYAVAYYKDINDVRFAHGASIKTTGDIIIPVTFPSLGTWNCLFIATLETAETTEAEESVYMPGGLFTININRVYKYANVTITSEFNMWLDDDAIYGFHYPTISVSADSSFPQTTGRLDLEVYCYNSSGAYLGRFEVVDNSENAEFSYSGTATETTTLDFLAGNSILFDTYAPDMRSEEISYVDIYAKVTVVSGDGIFKMAGTYKWTVNRQ